MGFLFSSKKEKLVAVFDIGSGSVGGALVRISNDKNKLPTIIKSARTDIVYRENVDFNQFLGDMITSLGTTATLLHQSKLGAPSEIFCVLASPWYVSETRVIKMSKDVPFVFSSKMIDELIKKEISSVETLYKTKYGNVSSAPEIIEHPILGVFLNGYRIDNPIGEKVKNFKVDLAISLSPSICLDKVKEEISKTFTHTKVSFSSFMLASYISIRDRYITNDSYMIFDISGEITDVGIVTNGVLDKSASFPYGRNTLIRNIGKSLNIELRDTLELLSLYSKGTLEEGQLNKLNEVLKASEELWGASFKECINSLLHVLIIPSIVFLTIDRDIKDWFVKVINNGEHIQSMVSGKQFTLITIDGPDFLNMCSVENETCDPFLMIEAISVVRKMELYE